MKLDKLSWKKVKLGDVVTKREEVDRANAKNEFDLFIKVDHLDAESLHVKRWASQEAHEIPPTFYKIFRKGQVLFPTRNPHLKRASLAHFDGICGEKTLTIEANSEIILPEFLPFLFHCDAFYAHTTSSIVGSTNPHVRWRDVAKFEFLLPSINVQRELSELLWCGDETIESSVRTKSDLSSLLNAEVESEIHGVDIAGKTINQVLSELSKSINVIKLKELGSVFKGRGIPKAEVLREGIPCVRYGELYTKHHRIIRDFDSYISEESAEKAVQLKKNDVLFAGSGETITEIGKSACFIHDDKAYSGSDILIFRPHDMDGVYLGYLMNSQLVRQQLNKFGTGATVMHIYAADVEKLQVPDLGKDKQIAIGQRLETITKEIFLMDEKIAKAKELQKVIINQVF
ncbi:restriction endonuclease subunit S [Parahaliea maris]|uniref:Restriction endonuclease subunit S n=1 Tax=Parahaliea maris TaxID=2716870 RepID=A0A5C8ZT05_9GAMM|nr:restriction endonuclease subunit S [Parahaliea maris]TXS90810.1 restriction endonuclease subunit S [Parahaliea maris]